MHHPGHDILLQVIRQPQRMGALLPQQWEELIRLGRSAGLLARLNHLAQRHDVWASIPGEVRRHLVSAQALVARQHRELGYELQEIDLTLRGLGMPVVLLKGPGRRPGRRQTARPCRQSRSWTRCPRTPTPARPSGCRPA